MSAMPTNAPRDIVMALLSSRAFGATICPSEVARVLAKTREASSSEWRPLMPIVHDTVDVLLAEGKIQLSWKGLPLATRSGPYRIRSRP